MHITFPIKFLIPRTMGVVNILAKFSILPETQDGSFIVEKGSVRILGTDDATAAILQTQFPELQSFPSASTSTNSSPILRTSQEGLQMSLEDALATATSYLNILDQQDYTIVSGFKDNLLDASDGSKYTMYIWTLQK
ncbi:unnamed protein product [Orchesella dallaii]|uniref:Uncharacterized protein n=1 Tax=Orchesella dallaii TaxID=48710 RepID=A0ABP1R390_9HEXA